MTVVAMPTQRYIPCDANGRPENQWSAEQLAVNELLTLINEALPDVHLGRQDAEWIAHNMIKQYLSRLVRVR